MALDPSLVASVKEAPSNDKLSELSQLGTQLEVELGIIEELEKAIEESKLKIASLQEKQIPDLMRSVGLEEIKLSSGTKVALQPVYSASLPKDEMKREEALAWLRINDHGALIKNTIFMAYGMGEEGEAQLVKDYLGAKGIPFSAKEDVHAMTLKAFVKERYEKGEQFPEELFGAFTRTVAQIKKTKGNK